MTHLASWLNQQRIQYVTSVADWKEAIHIAASPLLQEGVISPAYVEAIIGQKEEIGPYFVIAPRIAMPHARPEQGANGLGLSIVRLATPVTFDADENDPVDALFMFSAPDSNSHIEMISALAEVLSDEDAMAAIFNAGSQHELSALLMGEKSDS